MAEDYLNCGNPTLEDATRAWAKKHGYNVVTQPGNPFRFRFREKRETIGYRRNQGHVPVILGDAVQSLALVELRFRHRPALPPN